MYHRWSSGLSNEREIISSEQHKVLQAFLEINRYYHITTKLPKPRFYNVKSNVTNEGESTEDEIVEWLFVIHSLFTNDEAYAIIFKKFDPIK